MSTATALDPAAPRRSRRGGRAPAAAEPACIAPEPAVGGVRAAPPPSLCAELAAAGAAPWLGDRFYPAGHDLLVQGQAGEAFFVIAEGWAAQYELLKDGRRQILDFLLPGALAGFQPDAATPSPCSIQALTGVAARCFSRRGFVDAAAGNPALALELAALAAKSQARLLRRLTLIGRRSAKERVATLLLELYCGVRMASPRLRGDAVAVPLTQEHLGDALGLTNVHVNRMLRELREERVLVLRGGVLRVLDPDRLVEIAGHEPA